LRVLLDECLPRRLARLLTGHEVKTVPQMDWAGLENGALLSLADGRFDAFVTIDRSLSFQQNISRFKLFLVVLHAKSNRLSDVAPLAPGILKALGGAVPGQATHVGA
jgi:hypothetical protein